ncbi:hypothetical protein PV11_01948 [Exophiala sideris]|uniref:Uncharacterized protein n=1 Tax=Exophiala sideris TaxID=1016849 RepID=A0A0D1XE62_9EURO|nr:hypothetical protein PV11_01948 [Exophiala sideris]
MAEYQLGMIYERLAHVVDFGAVAITMPQVTEPFQHNILCIHKQILFARLSICRTPLSSSIDTEHLHKTLKTREHTFKHQRTPDFTRLSSIVTMSAPSKSSLQSTSTTTATTYQDRAEDAILEMRAREAVAAMETPDGHPRRCSSPERKRILGAIVRWELRKLEREGGL